MDMIADIALDAGKDTLALVPFLLVTYVALELLEHAAGERVNTLVHRAGAAGPVAGALLGVLPQCGFSAMGATLYAGRVVTLGTLIAVFLSTSDEMLPMLVAERVDASLVVGVLGLKALIALVTGLAVDGLLRLLRHNGRVHAVLRRTVLGVPSSASAEVTADVIDQMAEAGEGAGHIHILCEQDRCGCADGHGAEGHGHGHDHGHDHGHGGLVSAVRSAVSHTVQVGAFIFLVSFVLAAVMHTVGEAALTGLLSGNEGLAVIAAALVGLIPNCSASVVITQLYLEGVLGFGPMMSGLLVSAGVGYLVLFRTNRHPRENAVIVAVLFTVACLWGFVLGVIGL